MRNGSDTKSVIQKEFDSIFAPQTKITVDQYITEMLLLKRVEWLIKTKKIQNKPTCAFWQKELAEQHKEFQFLADIYKVEISYVRSLLKSFLPKSIITVLEKERIFSLRYAKLADQQRIIYEIWRTDTKLKTFTLPKKELDSQTESAIPIKPANIINRPTLGNKLTDLLS